MVPDTPHTLAIWEYRIVFIKLYKYVIIFILMVFIACAIKWRKYFWEILTAISLISAIVILFLWIVTWNGGDFAIPILGVRPQSDGTVHRWVSMFDSQYGGIRYVIWETEVPASEVTIRNRTKQTSLTFQHGENPAHLYPIQGPIDSLAHPWPWYQKAGFQIFWKNYPADPNHETQIAAYSVTVPHWFAILLCLPFPLIWFHRFRRRRYRLRHNLCLSCGYDLRESSEKCPECGKIRDLSEAHPQDVGISAKNGH